jgi:hypothetical protein
MNNNNNKDQCSFRNLGCLWALSTSVYQPPRTVVHSNSCPHLWFWYSVLTLYRPICVLNREHWFVNRQSVRFFLLIDILKTVKFRNRQGVNRPALSWWWGCHLLGIRLPLIETYKSMAFSPQFILRLSRLYSVTRASSVLTGSATRRWGWCLGRRGYIALKERHVTSPWTPSQMKVYLKISRLKYCNFHVSHLLLFLLPSNPLWHLN